MDISKEEGLLIIRLIDSLAITNPLTQAEKEQMLLTLPDLKQRLITQIMHKPEK